MSSAATISVSQIGLAGTDRSVLKVAMGLLDKSGCNIQILESGDGSGNVILIDTDSEEGRSFYRDFQVGRGQTLVLLTAEATDTQNHLVLKKPLRVQTLRDVVYDVYQESKKTFSLPGKTPPAPEPVVEAAPAAPFDPASNLFSILLGARNEQKILQIFYPPFPALYVDSTKGVLASSASRETLRKMARSFSGRINVVKLSPADFEILARGQIISPLDNFLWSAALFGSQGQIATGLSPTQPMRLKAWPNLSRVDFEPDHMSMTSLLARRPMSLQQLQEAAKAPLDRVIGFYNAAWVTRLLEPAVSDGKNAPPPGIPAVAEKKSGLLAKIARRLNLDAK